MKYKLINPVNPKYNAIQQVLTNRGVPYADINHYLHTSDEDINPPELLGEEKLKAAAVLLMKNIQAENPVIVVVDCDCDGYTSSAIIINYLHELFPSWVEEKVTWIIHDGKQHGLNDCVEEIIVKHPNLVIIPDAGTNDINECKMLHENGIDTIILDHHDAEVDNTEANVVINNQIGDYPNKELSGAGVVWQFCRYLDKLLESNKADKFRDLVALGLDADMMSLLSVETKHLILDGFKETYNPFITYLAEKNDYSLKGKLTPIGVAFYIAPFVNAIVRSGTQEEKELTFRSMLSYTAFEVVPSTKRGHKLGDTEKVVEQAMRVVTNVKARQTKAQDSNMEMLETMIQEQDLLKHKVLLFLLEPGQIDKNIAGLCANKIMAKYQRPVCILTKVVDDENNIFYQGSARGCDKVDVRDFKGVCAATQVVEYTIGHPGAFGVSIKKENIDEFLNRTDEALKDMPDEAIYYVDYIFTNDTLNPENILDIAGMEYFWGKDIEEALVAVKNIKVTPDMVTIYDKKTTTIKISLNNGISLMLFNAKEKDCKKLQTNNTGYVEISVVGTCNANEWLGDVTPQIFITEYEIVDSNKFIF